METFLAFMLLISSTFETESCHVDWIQYQDKCYFFSHTNASWYDAGSTCLQFHSKLAEPRTYAEIHFLRGHAQSMNKDIWIGVSDLLGEDRWVFSSTQEEVQHGDFGPGEPNGYTGQNCVALSLGVHGRWMDHMCTASLRYVCEEDLSTNPGYLIG